MTYFAENSLFWSLIYELRINFCWYCHNLAVLPDKGVKMDVSAAEKMVKSGRK